MKLKISRSVTTEDLKKSFMESFDGLKIEFFYHSHAHEQGSPKKDMVRESLALSELNSDLHEEEVNINGDMKVSEVEDLFERHLGLHIQVFRKMNISWIETTATDGYTLNKQVAMSRESRGI